MNILNQWSGRLASQYPALGTHPVKIGKMFTPEYFELEKEKIFKKTWLNIARQEEIPNAGDYIVRELEVCDTSVLIVRGEDMKVRAFHNVCSHRLNRVAYEVKGNAKHFKCRFHSWTYGLDGSLTYLPQQDMFPGVERCDNGLTSIHCDTWEGFIFVNVDPAPGETLREYIGEEFWDMYNGFMESKPLVGKLTVDVQCNWKICLDAFCETYHFSTVHAKSAGGLVNSKANPFGFMDAVRLYDRHRSISTDSNPDHIPSFVESLARKYTGGASIAPDLSRGGKGLPPGLNPGKMKFWGSDIIVLFPMAYLHPYMNFMTCQNYWPISHNRTRWEYMIHQSTPTSATHDVAAEFNRAIMRDVIREDFMNLEWVQSNLSSGAKKVQHLGDQEIMLRHHYKVVSDFVGCGYWD